MATGEHYFFDVLLGWLYAGAVMGAWEWWERRRTSTNTKIVTVPLAGAVDNS